MVAEFFQNILGALAKVLTCSSLLAGFVTSRSSRNGFARPSRRSLKDLERDIQSQFTSHITSSNLLYMSVQLQRDYHEKLQSSPQCMLPSYNHTLPSGQETGTYLALDVGGSTFRVALVSLSGKTNGEESLKIIRITSLQIDETIRALHGSKFFDWMATGIQATLAEGGNGITDSVLPMGLSWSFPIEQTSSRSGRIQHMGKGFNCSAGTLGEDLGDTITAACDRIGLKVKIDAIINDSSATLLSRAYLDPSTSISLILGTGTNAAIHLPVSLIGPEKFGSRDVSWYDQAEKVITNTELSMFGGKILPRTHWDDQLNQSHVLPDFQPLEYMVTGRYLGEILRLIVLEGVHTAGLFGGIMPASMSLPYSLDTTFLAILESDTTQTMSRAAAYLEKAHTFPTLPTVEDLNFLRSVAECVSTRAAAYLATSVHALWALGRQYDNDKSLQPKNDKTTIACDGSVINKYPGFRDMCQSYIASMIAADGFAGPEVVLEPAHEAAILGAAVAVAICEAEEHTLAIL